LVHQQCVKGDRKFTLIGVKKLKDDCPDGTCDESETCCQLENGDWGCCPYSEATCCSDKAHCCPHGYDCDLVHQQCIKGDRKITLSGVKKLKDDCPDGTCDQSETCCQLENGDWGCCPYSEATCCSDKAHCCPNGYDCDLVHQQCIKGSNRVLLSGVKKLKDDCPDGTCDQSETCCQLENGDWGCCPYSEATCCSDKAHCCPNGYDCDLVHQQCVKGNLPLTKPTLRNDCDCSSSSTCCLIEDGKYGCCPYTQATCCSDKAHCCPSGYRCDLEHSQCVPNAQMLKKFKMSTIRK